MALLLASHHGLTLAVAGVFMRAVLGWLVAVPGSNTGSRTGAAVRWRWSNALGQR
jgi:hypothetical protein